MHRRLANHDIAFCGDRTETSNIDTFWTMFFSVVLSRNLFRGLRPDYGISGTLTGANSTCDADDV